MVSDSRVKFKECFGVMKVAEINRWMRWLHIYSAVPVLLSMIFFAVTGFFLNHPDIPLGETRSKQHEVQLPETFADLDWINNKTYYSLSLLNWLDQSLGIRGVKIEIEWEDDDLLMIVLEGPNASQSIDVYPEEGLVEIFSQTLSFMQMLNNLHRAKSVSEAWRWFSDLSAIFMLVFCLTGFWLVLANKMQRVSGVSWITLGSVVMVLIVYMMH